MPPSDVMNPKIYVIAGPNGAGKNDLRPGISPKLCRLQEIHQCRSDRARNVALLPGNDGFRVGRLMLEEIETYARRRETFAFETTLSGLSYVSLLKRLKKSGYEVHFFYLWVRTVS